jgi:hypothetical protein
MPLNFLHRRHLDESQRAMVAARIANIRQGGDRKSENYQTANLQFDSATRAEAAELLNVSERAVNTAKKVLTDGTEELIGAVEQGELAVSTAAELGVSHQTIDNWEMENTSNANIGKASIPPPDWRVKLSAEKRQENSLKMREKLRRVNTKPRPSPRSWLTRQFWRFLPRRAPRGTCLVA